MGASVASAEKSSCSAQRWKMQIPDILAPIAVEILFCGGKAAAKKIATESGNANEKEQLVCCSSILIS